MILFCKKKRTLSPHRHILITVLLFLAIGCTSSVAQIQSSEKLKKAGRKVQKGYVNENADTVAQGYYDLGESYYSRGEFDKSEEFFKKSKMLYDQQNDIAGSARAGRALARVQEDLKKTHEAVVNYREAAVKSSKTRNEETAILNRNDADRLLWADSLDIQNKLLNSNINSGLQRGDTGEIAVNYSRIGDNQIRSNNVPEAIGAYTNAYNHSRGIPEQAARYNQKITDLYIEQNNLPKAIETKKEILKENFIANSSELKAQEIASLASIYLLKNEDSTAIRLLNESYELSVRNGHTVQAKECIVKLDSIYQDAGRRDLSLKLYKEFLSQLPTVLAKDSSLIDTKVIAETEFRIKELENDKALRDDLIRRKNIFNYWLLGSIILLLGFVGIVLYMMKKLRVKNRKIALQSLRREMNPHFIFNSLNSINQFIATKNELEANQYLTKFSVLMRRVMENSKDDFVLLQKELELLQNYLELERSRFPDKFDFSINVDDSLLGMEEVFIPSMLIQPHLENSVWHGLRYIEGKGWLKLDFRKNGDRVLISIEDNGIGLEESRKQKTTNQKKHKGRGIDNTHERIAILNELYNLKIECKVEDKTGNDRGVRVEISIPLLNKNKNED